MQKAEQNGQLTCRLCARIIMHACAMQVCILNVVLCYAVC